MKREGKPEWTQQRTQKVVDVQKRHKGEEKAATGVNTQNVKDKAGKVLITTGTSEEV